MIGLVLVTHGRLAEEFVHALEHIVGRQEGIETICIGPDDRMEARRADITAAVARADKGQGVIILTDMFGGTPANVSLTWLEENKVEVLTGVNLPMLLKLATSRGAGADLHEIALALTAYGQKNVCCASELLRTRAPAPKGAL